MRLDCKQSEKVISMLWALRIKSSMLIAVNRWLILMSGFNGAEIELDREIFLVMLKVCRGKVGRF